MGAKTFSKKSYLQQKLMAEEVKKIQESNCKFSVGDKNYSVKNINSGESPKAKRIVSMNINFPQYIKC